MSQIGDRLSELGLELPPAAEPPAGFRFSFAWVRLSRDPGYPETTNVINGFSDFVLDVFGQEIGHHARMAVGMATLPLNHCVIVGAQLAIDE